MKIFRWSLIFLLFAMTVFTIKMITVFALPEEELSAAMSFSDVDYKMVYEFSLMNRDGTITKLRLIKFNSPICSEIDGQKGCLMGFTKQISNYTRRTDSDHPVDTTEFVNLVFIPGKIPKVDEENIMHELYHANDYHYHSRQVCETNWRYSECMESQAYNYTYLLKQVRDLQKQKLIKLI